MATENDPIDRALRRASGVPGSPLEKLVRANAYKLVNGTETDDAKLDSFINEARANPFYSASFTAPPGPAKAAGIDTLALSEEQRSGIADGKIVVEPGSAHETATVPGTVRPSEEELDEIIASGKVRVG
jgi:hypothetical protein